MECNGDDELIFLFPDRVLGMDESAVEQTRQRDGMLGIADPQVLENNGQATFEEVKNRGEHITAIGFHTLLRFLSPVFLTSKTVASLAERKSMFDVFGSFVDREKNTGKYNASNQALDDSEMPRALFFKSDTGSVTQANIKEIISAVI